MGALEEIGDVLGGYLVEFIASKCYQFKRGAKHMCMKY
jgi:hypothetical protein